MKTVTHDYYDLCQEIKRKFHFKNTEPGYRHYCLILKVNENNWNGVTCYGCNSNEFFYNMPSKHAEMDAITKIKKWKNMHDKFDMLVVRFNKTGDLSESRPCPHCVQFMQNFSYKSNKKIKNIYYSTKEGVIVKESFNDIKKSPIIYISSGFRNKIRFKKNNNSKNDKTTNKNKKGKIE